MYIEGWLVPAFKGKIVSKLQTTDFERFLSGLTRVRTNATRNRIRGICSSVMAHAVRTGYARENPVLGVRKLREEERAVPVLDHAEQLELVEAAPDALRPLIQLALGSGLRLAELLGLEWHDVDLATGSLTVRVAKSKRPRVIFLTAETCAVLRDLRDARAIPLDGPDRVFWWLPAENRPFQDTHRHAWCRAMKQLGRPGFRIHDCRHYADLVIMPRPAAWSH
jgi:integrase